MKVFTLNEIHHVNKKTGKPEVAEPSRIIDLPQEEALRLIDKLAVRRLTAQEIELDKLKAGRATAAADAGADDGAEGDDGDTGTADATAAPAEAKTGSRGRGRTAAAKADNAADTGDTGGY